MLEQHDGEVELPLSAWEPARDLLDRAASLLAGVLNPWPWLGRASVASQRQRIPARRTKRHAVSPANT